MASIVNGFTRYATVRYRAAGLRWFGLTPRDYATAEPAPRRIFVTPFPNAGADGDETQVTPETVTLARRWADNLTRTAHAQNTPRVEDAIYRFRTVQGLLRRLDAAEHDLATRPRTPADSAALTAAGLTVHQGRPYRRWDIDAGTHAVTIRLATDTGHPLATVQRVVAAYRGAAAVTGFRVRALTAAGIPDNLSTRVSPQPRLRPTHSATDRTAASA